MQFHKMNGLGNEIVVIDARAGNLALDADAARLIGNPATGPGCDQIMVIEPGKRGADVWTSIWNNSGEEVEACGNGARCVAAYLHRDGITGPITMGTLGGTVVATDAGNGNITIDMGAPRFDWRDIPLAEEIRDTRAIELQIGPIDAPILHSPSVANVGNPHAVFWVDDPERFDLEKIGPMLENHPMFPQRANISLAHVIDRATIRTRVWERGAGATRACGTAACAIAVSAARTGRTGRDVTVHLPGGPLHIAWRETDDHILMTGPTEFEFSGDIDIAGVPA
ncbi:diaminopimelate epimerase [Pyruvatibacter sp.]|uniref:diaminopimelate epimerase n=1 Tax=Pyruvatibacter sp. TaxID=1981328 RepID=UPI0032EE46E6